VTFIKNLQSRSKTLTPSTRSEAELSGRNLVRNHVSIWAALIVSMLSFTQTAQSADLTDIRTGFHTTYSRVVIQFDSDVKFQVIKDGENGAIIIDVLSVNAVRNFLINVTGSVLG